MKVQNIASEKAYHVADIRTKIKNAYMPWLEEDDEELTILYCEKTPIKEIARRMERTTGAIKSRIEKLELKDLYSM